MTIKRGDIVFVTQGHASQEVSAVVLQPIPGRLAGLPDARVHILSSADPYSTVTVSHRQYADDVGYLESGESEPTEARPVETKKSERALFTPEVDNNSEETTLGGDPPNDHSEEEDDERQEDEGAEEVPEDESDGEPVSTPKGKRGGKSRR